MIVAGPDFRGPPNLTDVQVIFIILCIAVIAPSIELATFILTSWFRDPMRNDLVGGVPNSLHQVALALDVDIDTSFAANVFTLAQASRQLAEAIAKRWRAFGPSFQAVVESDHLHLELDLR